MTLYLDNFHPSGEPILLQRLRCSPLAVYTYSFVSCFLAATAMSARE
jgi:hypothetical protein